jgi:SAM-dependent methyltransferase
MPTPDRPNETRQRARLRDRVVHRAKLLRNALTERTPPPLTAESFARTVPPGRFAVESDTASVALIERLSAAEIAEVERKIDAHVELAPTYRGTRDATVARHVLLAYGTWLGDPTLLERTALTAVQPPPAIHAMAHGPLAAAGGLYEADMIANALASAGVAAGSLHDALDFGCSSGRVLRVLAAAFPDVHWLGCDPNAEAIAWAQATFPQLECFVSANEPPLPLSDAALDLVYAISIWSHFAPELGRRWFEEMRRVIRPGGHLVFTTHGWTSLASAAELGHRPLEECEEIQGALYRDGYWFLDPFGEAGDWGVVNPQWGSAFLTPEFVLGQLCPHWRVVEFVPGRNQENQDVYVLARA